MHGKSTSMYLSSHPDLLDIDSEFVVNLKFLLDGGQSDGLAQQRASIVSGVQKNDRGSDIDSLTSPSVSSIENVPMPSSTSVPSDVLAPRRGQLLKTVPEGDIFSELPLDTVFNTTTDQSKRRAFHTTIFQGNDGKVSDSVDLGIRVNLPMRSKSMGKRNMSARIQSLLENFESPSSKFEPNLSSIPETGRGIDKRPVKFSPEASVSGNKVLLLFFAIIDIVKGFLYKYIICLGVCRGLLRLQQGDLPS